MNNAKDEILELMQEYNLTLKCAHLSRELNYDGDEIEYTLKVNHTTEDCDAFLKEIDFNYDNGYGGQQLFGILWFTDNTWASRGEYDGSEWWDYNKLPDIAKECYDN